VNLCAHYFKNMVATKSKFALNSLKQIATDRCYIRATSIKFLKQIMLKHFGTMGSKKDGCATHRSQLRICVANFDLIQGQPRNPRKTLAAAMPTIASEARRLEKTNTKATHY
jgi:hypothetical protein